MAKPKQDLKRLNMYLPVALYERLSEYADSVNLSKTSALIVLLNNALENAKAMKDLSFIVEEMKEQKAIEIENAKKQ